MPAQGLRILKGGVRASNAKDGQQMCGITREHNAIVDIVGQCERAGRVNRAPIHFPRRAFKANHFELSVNALL